MKKAVDVSQVCHTFEVPYGSCRLDQVLARESVIKSRVVAQKLIEHGAVSIGASVQKKASKIIPHGTIISVFLPSSPLLSTKKDSAIPLTVLYEDEYCFVVDKPPHIAVHRGTGMAADEETILDGLEPLFAERKLPFSSTEVLVHRLDRDTTGVLLIAKTPLQHLALQKQFASRTVQKTYLTIVYGVPKLPTATIDAPIGRHSTERTKMSVHRGVNPRHATTTYRVTASGLNASLLECDLHTGRTHQIRVHLSSIGHPVLGDATYGNRAAHDFSASKKIASLCLHATRLTFQSGKKTVTVESPLPLRFSKILQKLNIALPCEA